MLTSESQLSEIGEGLTNEVTEVLQLHGEIDVVDPDAIWDIENGGGEVENGLDAVGDDCVDDQLGGAGWNGEDGHFYGVFEDDARHFLHGEDGGGGVGPWRRVLIESGGNFKALFVESTVTEQRGAEVPHTDENDRLQPGGAEHFRQLSRKAFHVVSESPSAEVSKMRQVLAELGWFHPGRFGQCLRGNGLRCCALELLQASLVD